MVETMRQFTEDMTYEWLEDEDCFISKEKVIDGVVRVIEGELRYAERGIIDRDYFDVLSCTHEKETRVVFWRLVDHL